MKFRAFAEPQADREEIGSAVQVENGYPSIVVDGRCCYWIGGGWIDTAGKGAGWRTGTLDPSLEAELARLIPINDPKQIEDCVPDQLFDAPPRTFRSERGNARCIRGGPRFEAAWKFLEDRGPELWSRATPLEGGIRLEASSTASDAKAYPWPLDRPLAGFLIREDVSPAQYTGRASGVSHLVPESSGGRALRGIREQYFTDRKTEPGFHMQLEMMDGATSAVVFLRDALPYEDERGLLPFSDPTPALLAAGCMPPLLGPALAQGGTPPVPASFVLPDRPRPPPACQRP